MLISLGCCISYTDKSKTKTLNSNSGQTALYWIIRNTPDCVIELLKNIEKQFSFNIFNLGRRSVRSVM